MRWDRFSVHPRLFSDWARKKGFWRATTSRLSPNWCEASAKYVMPRARAIIRYGGCTPNAGWNRSSCEMSRRWTNASSRPAYIPRCRHSPLPIRAMIDVLTMTRDGRLAVLELKADEDIHLPLQGLDYWSRVSWHHIRGEFQRFGYFPGRELRADKPILFLVAPALHVHPATDTLLHYISPELDWTLLGIDERWREGVRVVFRKRPVRNAHTKAS